ncbi:YgiT-type zinc finger protein [Candidatus Poribacteria bacterium]|nr:YgiT-type zinc finger protein [Candidatus Poribacteria bacterium]
MKPKSGQMICSLCGGQLEAQRVRVVRERAEQLAVFENIPAKVCQKCGHRWFGLQVVQEMEVSLSAAPSPVRTLRVPVYALEDC